MAGTPGYDLTTALNRWRCGEGSLSELAVVGGSELDIITERQAHAVADALVHLRRRAPEGLEELNHFTSLIARVGSEEAFEVIWDRALVELRGLVDDHGPVLGENTILYLFKLYVALQYLDGLQQVVDYIRCGRFPEAYLWSDIFDDLHAAEPLAHMVIDALGPNLPTGYCAIAYLDMANALAREGRLDHHPFDSVEGRARLRDWLLDRSNPWYGRSAVAALPFVSGIDQVELLYMGMGHQLAEVRLQAAWAAARLGDTASLDLLVHEAGDPVNAGIAIAYLQELDAIDRLPAAVYDPAFQAQVAMVQWLADPSEFGEPPVSVSVVAHRRCFWPPIDAVRDFYLVRFTYASEDDEEVFVGLVGSVTTALLGEVDPRTMSFEDILAVHCCWELQRRNDPRAPRQRDVRIGRLLLALENPDQGFEL